MTKGIEATDDAFLEFEPDREEPDYVDYLRAYVSQAFDFETEPVPAPLLESLIPFLRSLTEEIAPPPPGLMEEAMAFLETQARSVEGVADFATVRDHLFEHVFPLLRPVDYTPLNPEGIERGIQKLTAGRDIKTLLDMFLFAFLGKKKRLELQKPGFVRRKWRRTGPFQVVGVDEAVLPISIPLSSVYLFDPNNDNHITGVRSLRIKEVTVPPKTTDVVTIDMAGFTMMVTEKKQTATLSKGIDLSALTFLKGASTLLGPSSCHAYAQFDPLGRPWCDYGAVVFPMHLLERREHIKGQFLTIAVRVNLKYYSAIIDLP